MDAQRWQPGDRVSIYPLVKGEGMTGESRLGGCCELVRIPAQYMIPIPDGLSDVEAASLPVGLWDGAAHDGDPGGCPGG